MADGVPFDEWKVRPVRRSRSPAPLRNPVAPAGGAGGCHRRRRRRRQQRCAPAFHRPPPRRAPPPDTLCRARAGLPPFPPSLSPLLLLPQVIVAERINRKVAKERAKLAAVAEAKAAAQEVANVAFNRWTVDKSVHDEALELVPQLGVHRAQDDAAWKEVGVAMAYVHLFVEARHRALNAVVDANPKRSIEYTFLTWSRRNHAFDSVRAPRGERRRPLPPPPNDGGAENDVDDGRGPPAEAIFGTPVRACPRARRSTLLTLQSSASAFSPASRPYFFPPSLHHPPTPPPLTPQVTISQALGKRFSTGTRMLFNEVEGGFEITGLSCVGIQRGADGMAKPLGADDKLRNGIFNLTAKRAWTSCLDEARAALAADSGGDAAKLERLAMQRGLTRLGEMVEADREAVEAKAKADFESRVATGKAGHTRWMERKDATRIKLPPHGTPLVEERRGPLDCSPYNPESVKVKVKGPGPLPNHSAVVVRRMGVGLKSGIAHGVGEQDILRSRAALLKEGHVFLENFASLEDGTIDDEARARYREELATNEALRLRREGAREKIERGHESFLDWVATKEASELALECMALMPVVLASAAPAALPVQTHALQHVLLHVATKDLVGGPRERDGTSQNQDVQGLATSLQHHR